MNMDYYPKISIIIPAKDEEQNIETCLASLQTIDYPKIKVEIILVDNGSVDATTSIARRYGVKVIEGPELRVAELRNLGSKYAGGELIVFIDADILVTKDWLSKGVLKIAESGCICLGGYIDIPRSNSWIEKNWHLRLEGRPEENYVEWVSSMNMFIKKEIFFKIGGFNEKLMTCEDVDLCFRIKKFGKILYTREARVIHLGEAKDLKHFFLKEQWRGQSNLLGVLSHGFYIDELASLVLPLYYLYFYLALVPLLIFGCSNYILFLHFAIFLAIPSTRAFLICVRLRRILCFFPLTFLWWLYYTARALAFVSFTKRRK